MHHITLIYLMASFTIIMTSRLPSIARSAVSVLIPVGNDIKKQALKVGMEAATIVAVTTTVSVAATDDDDDATAFTTTILR